MKILMLAGSLSRIGGIEKYNYDLYHSILKINQDIILVERNPGNWGAKLVFLIKIIKIILINKPVYIICGHVNFLPILFILNKFKYIPYSISIYGIEIIANLTPIVKTSILRANKVITISNYTKNLILKKIPEVKSKIFMLKSSINGDKFFIKKKDFNIKNKFNLNNKKIILTLARLSTNEDKGQSRVLSAMPKILKTIPNAIYLIVGGGIDKNVNKILEQNRQLLTSVFFTGAISDSEKNIYYNLADVFVMPSKTEGFGIVFIEALACGLPVICSEGYGCREGLLNGELGTLVNPDDIDEIANQIISVIKNYDSYDIVRRNQIRKKTLEIYGMKQWDQKVNTFINLVRI